MITSDPPSAPDHGHRSGTDIGAEETSDAVETSDPADITDILTRDRPDIDAEMRAVLGDRDLPIFDMARYALGWLDTEGQPRANGAGKGLRPVLCLLAAEAVNASPSARARALAAAAAVELVHNYSLVHDDIQDGDQERHHNPTVWFRWGMPQAINVGDALRELAQIALQRAQAAGAPPTTVLDAYQLLNMSSLEMIEGQYLDLAYEQRSTVGPDEYLDMVGRKTGVMIGCSMALGALLASGNRTIADQFGRAGRRLGLCFQIRDDALGIWGDETMTGKSSDNDIRRRKKSYPIVYAFRTAGEDGRATLNRIYSRAEPGGAEVSDADLGAVLRILDQLGAREATDLAAQQQYDAFHQELDGCALSPASRATFTSIAKFMLQRDH
jgi:geranylgeranyl diphosphate synthase type I